MTARVHWVKFTVLGETELEKFGKGYDVPFSPVSAPLVGGTRPELSEVADIEPDNSRLLTRLGPVNHSYKQVAAESSPIDAPPRRPEVLIFLLSIPMSSASSDVNPVFSRAALPFSRSAPSRTSPTPQDHLASNHPRQEISEEE